MRTAAATPSFAYVGFWDRLAVDRDGTLPRGAAHSAIHAAHADVDDRGAIGAGERLGKRVL